MLTARGQPDLATRAFLRRLSLLLPAAPVVALVDYNPSGALILGTYRGTHAASARTAQDGRYGVDVRWLAARSVDLGAADQAAHLPLTQRDLVLLNNLLARCGDMPAQEGVARELRAMAAAGCKIELEHLYSQQQELTPLLLHRLLREDYV